MIVTQTENVTRIIVNNRYFPRRGTAKDVGGMISANKRKNTPNESMIEMLNDTCYTYIQKKTEPTVHLVQYVRSVTELSKLVR